MAKFKRRAKPINAREKVVIVRATRGFSGRTPADVPLSAKIPSSHAIAVGTIGILEGPAPGAPDLRVVAFEVQGGTVRVEVQRGEIEPI